MGSVYRVNLALGFLSKSLMGLSLVLNCLFKTATMSVRVQDQNTEAVPLRRGVSQGHFISPKLFNNAIEDAFITTMSIWEKRSN